MGYTYFQPMANPHDGSRNRLENAENAPATGNAVTSSPMLCMVQNCKAPVAMYASKSEAGPP